MSIPHQFGDVGINELCSHAPPNCHSAPTKLAMLLWWCSVTCTAQLACHTSIKSDVLYLAPSFLKFYNLLKLFFILACLLFVRSSLRYHLFRESWIFTQIEGCIGCIGSGWLILKMPKPENTKCQFLSKKHQK